MFTIIIMYIYIIDKCHLELRGNDHTGLDEKTDTVFMGYRASCQSSTKQSPLLQNNEFSPVEGSAIHIHHISNSYWVTSSAVGKNEESAVYDSKFSGGNLSSSLIHQQAIISQDLIEDSNEEAEAMLPVHVSTVQLQVGTSNSGIFAMPLQYTWLLDNE